MQRRLSGRRSVFFHENLLWADFGMRVEPFDLRKPNKMVFHFTEFFLCVVHDIADLRVVMNGQRREKPRRPTGRKHVIRSGDIVRHGGRSISAQEERPSVPYVFEIIERLVH